MSGYPEDITAEGICYMEGHDWQGGGSCVRCGERLRCACGQFVAEDGIDSHLRRCPDLERERARERREIESTWL